MDVGEFGVFLVESWFGDWFASCDSGLMWDCAGTFIPRVDGILSVSASDHSTEILPTLLSLGCLNLCQ